VAILPLSLALPGNAGMGVRPEPDPTIAQLFDVGLRSSLLATNTVTARDWRCATEPSGSTSSERLLTPIRHANVACFALAENRAPPVHCRIVRAEPAQVLRV